MNFENILLEIKNNIAIITLNRPSKLNALNLALLNDLKVCLTEIKKDDNAKVIIITGSGEKAFAAGADISELNTLSVNQAKEYSEAGQTTFKMIENFPKPVIAVINGFALGGGCELAMACHLRYASDNAYFGQPEINIGLIPGFGGTQRLSRLIGKAKAIEMILTGDRIKADEALSLKLINKIFELPNLLPEVIKIAEVISKKSAPIIKLALESMNSANNLSLSDGLSFETLSFSLCFGTEDFKEGTTAFLEKRNPEFKGK